MKNPDLAKDFLDVIRENERIIYKVCSFYVSDENPLPDMYQEIVCNLWSAFPKFRNECALSTWIYRISLNTCISGLRKIRKLPEKDVLTPVLQDSIPEPESMNEQIKELYRLIHQLKTIEKAIVLLYLEEKSYQEIADITGLSVSNVATKLKRAKEKMRKMSNQ
jgi:RNA polymerase sigma factor, sigma-70 family